MSPVEGVALDEDAAEDLLPWSVLGMDEESLEELQAARVSARTVVTPAAAIVLRRANRREEEIIEGVFPGGRTTPVARGEGQGAVPVPAGGRVSARACHVRAMHTWSRRSLPPVGGPRSPLPPSARSQAGVHAPAIVTAVTARRPGAATGIRSWTGIATHSDPDITAAWTAGPG
ncbi:hypothetical protein OHB53_08280 [Streptomyces sp. NBC_00056]|uniref:hypothetical protein n=1 Tax=Streptomyces sp. NBC_00056 TaxID=2975633 RepID=UPI00324F653E